MKKALVILLALSMVFAAFADEPAVKNEVAEFTGNASVTWGVNLDTGKTGFTNSESANLKFTLMGTGDKATAGEGVWGELKIKVGDPLQYDGGAWKNGTASVDTAKIHIGENFAINIRSGNVKNGGYKLALAAASDSDTFNVGEFGGSSATTNGITFEVALPSLLNLNIDFRSAPSAKFAYTNVGYKDAFGVNPTEPISVDDVDPTAYDKFDDYYVAYLAAEARKNTDPVKSTNNTIKSENDKLKLYNDWKKAREEKAYNDYGNYAGQYGIAADVNVTAVDNLTLKVGFGMDFYGAKEKGLFAQLGYAAKLDDKFFIEPQVAFGMDFADKMKLAAGLLFGWGDKNKDPIKFMTGKVSNGFSVATLLDLKNISKSTTKVPLAIAVYDQTFVENLAVGVEFDVDNIKKFSDKITLAFDAKYSLENAVPTIGVKFEKAATNTLNVYAACDLKDLVANTTFTVAYESANLMATAKPKLGTINLTAKIHF